MNARNCRRQRSPRAVAAARNCRSASALTGPYDAATLGVTDMRPSRDRAWSRLCRKAREAYLRALASRAAALAGNRAEARALARSHADFP
jgi:hypothetical protein